MLVAITVWLITLISVVIFVARYWWFPESAVAHGDAVDQQFNVTLFVTGLVFVPAQLVLGYLVVRYRERPGQAAHYSHGNNKMEVIWTSATAVLFYIMVMMGQGVWYDLYIAEASPDAVRIEVTGQQFAWSIRYPGGDGRFGRTRPDLIDDSAGNMLGLDPDDPAARDDLVLPTMAVPVNRPVELLLRSKDVTHSFFVRELRVKQDTVPGMIVPLRFTPTATGRFEIACAELCGLGHHRMRSFIEVLSATDYEQWLRDQSE